jgi:hypothetical protein
VLSTPVIVKQQRWSSLLFVPSFYALVTWVVSYGLYRTRLIEWYASPGPGSYIVLFTILMFGIATVAWNAAFGRTLVAFHTLQILESGRDASRLAWYTPNRTLLLLHLGGFAGLAVHMWNMMSVFGGLQQIFFVLTTESHIIRQTEVDATGIYIAYSGWIAIALTSLRWGGGGRIPKWLLALFILQFAGNLLFIDRTRPVWLAFVSMLIVMPFFPYKTFAKALRRRIGAVVVAGLVAFFAIGFWVGKTGEYLENYGRVHVPYQIAGLLYYVTGSYPYLDDVIEAGEQPESGLQRTFYPFYKFGEMLRLNQAPPSQLLPFDDLPFPTNVGTFLEPYFSDGGYVLMLFAILIHAFGLNALGLFALRSWSPWGLFLWSTLCFVDFISFFVPKLVSAPIWLFAVLSIYAMYVRRLSPVASEDMEFLKALGRTAKRGEGF